MNSQTLKFIRSYTMRVYNDCSLLIFGRGMKDTDNNYYLLRIKDFLCDLFFCVFSAKTDENVELITIQDVFILMHLVTEIGKEWLQIKNYDNRCDIVKKIECILNYLKIKPNDMCTFVNQDLEYYNYLIDYLDFYLDKFIEDKNINQGNNNDIIINTKKKNAVYEEINTDIIPEKENNINENNISMLNQKIKSTQIELNHSKDENNRLNYKIENYIKDIEKLKEKIFSYKKEIQNKQYEIDKEQNEIKILNSKINDLTNTIDKVLSEKTSGIKDFSLKSYYENINNLRIENLNLKKENEKLNKKIKDLANISVNIKESKESKEQKENGNILNTNTRSVEESQNLVGYFLKGNKEIKIEDNNPLINQSNDKIDNFETFKNEVNYIQEINRLKGEISEFSEKVDSGDKLRLKDCKEELHNLLKQEKLAGATLIVMCNKQDINGALKVEEIKNLLELESITSRHWMIMPCCGLTGNGLKEGLNWIMDDISSRIFMLE